MTGFIVKIALILFASLSLADCAQPHPLYQPADSRPAREKQATEAVFADPGGVPGTIRVLSEGISNIQSKENEVGFQALRLRIVLRNESRQQPWFIDVRKQAVELPDGGELTPLLARSDLPGPPDFEVQPRESRTVDLFFKLPEPASSPKGVPAFDFHWCMEAGKTLVEKSASFDRIPVYENPKTVFPREPYPSPLAWGPFWWGQGWDFQSLDAAK